MPPRYVYWTIIAGGLPTAFRAADREDLLPTFQRIREKHPDAQMKYFARGKLWESPEAARADQRRDAYGDSRRGAAPGPPRPRDWRPGGEHRDPRQKFKDAKKARNQEQRADRFARKHGADQGQRGQDQRPRDQPGREGREKPHWRDRAPREKRLDTGWPPQPRDQRPGGYGGRREESGDAGQPRGRDQRPRWQDRESRPAAPRGRKPPRPHGPAGGYGSQREDFRGAGQPRARDQRPRWQDRESPPAAPRGKRPPRRDQRADQFARPRRDERRPSHDERQNRPPREKPHGDPLRRKTGPRPPQRRFEPPRFERNQGTEEPREPPRPRTPTREPRPDENPAPTAPPEPREPVINPPPPERGRGPTHRRRPR